MNKMELAKEFGKSLNDVEKIILFGSVARGEDKEESDVDILIISRVKQKTKDKVIEKVMDILLDTGTYISVKVISPLEFERLKNTHFIAQSEKEGVLIGEKQILMERAFARAQEDREEADYGLLSGIEEEARKVVEGAALFLTECEKIG